MEYNYFINLTPHPINIRCVGGYVSTYKPDAVSARVEQENKVMSYVEVVTDPYTYDMTGVYSDGMPIYHTEYGEVTGLPDPKPGIGYIVSSLVAAAAKDRDDLFIPGPAIRDDQGRIIGCEGLIKV